MNLSKKVSRYFSRVWSVACMTLSMRGMISDLPLPLSVAFSVFSCRRSHASFIVSISFLSSSQFMFILLALYLYLYSTYNTMERRRRKRTASKSLSFERKTTQRRWSSRSIYPSLILGWSFYG